MMRTRTLLMVFKGELVTLQIHLLKEAIKVNAQGIILLIIQLLLIMLSMISLYCKNGRKNPCTYCGLYNHHVSKCWKRLTNFRKLYKQRQREKRMQKICTHCQKRGHLIGQCWTLHPTIHPQHKKQLDKEIGKNGSGDSIIDVSQDDSQEDDVQQKKSPLSWLGKKWLDFLSKACIFCCKCTFQCYVCIYRKQLVSMIV
jgi:hypothetical protein